ncbi:unnamed protein product [Prorocentrum cordatum]|uniref:type I protein arginine methyltransferase n=1 Tax=Prorocentrum cordatum TaxID=2364126 RepID=A0ABN9PKP1_9DINO|nr:unnamed protein product [Polarella glacialis]
MAWRLPASKFGSALSAPAEWTLFDARLCRGRDGLHSRTSTIGAATLSMRTASKMDAIVTWTSMILDVQACRVSWEPGDSEATCWQYAHYFREPYDVSDGCEIDVSFELRHDGIWLAGMRTHGDSMELSPYHTWMLSDDPQRTSAYRKGIDYAVQSLRARYNGKVTVLDIGAGTGLLSFFAARAGAEVTACERAGTTVALASRIAEANQDKFKPGSVNIVHSKSMDLHKGAELAVAPHLIVSEIFGTDPLAESVLPVIADIGARFASASPPVEFLPCRCRLWGALAKVPVDWQARTESAVSCGIDIGEHMFPFESGRILVDLRDEFCDIELLTEPAILVTHRLVPPVRISGSSEAKVPLLPAPARLFEVMTLRRPEKSLRSSMHNELCIVMWFDADCSTHPRDDADDEMRISTSPTVRRGGHWTQSVQILSSGGVEEGVLDAVSAGQGCVIIRTEWNVDRTNFNVRVERL